ncbi:MAG: hypothetical protein A6F71_10405 [Cycloclasticus sp. symbiont of Poecilosclerida sp. M]|nr:MAG: hypothetical protein A6F71_10405 [Cycloclasticus sp. symbiont of Poecilosclerida sp. M]
MCSELESCVADIVESAKRAKILVSLVMTWKEREGRGGLGQPKLPSSGSVWCVQSMLYMLHFKHQIQDV